MKKNREKLFLILNIAIPILIGALTYYVISPDVIFVQQIDSFLGIDNHGYDIEHASSVIRFVRLYFLDMTWGYALVFALYLLTGNNTADLIKLLILAVAFSAVLEFLQITSLVKGTFDVIDIVAEALAEMVAVFIIKAKS